ncbi:aminopeptidase P family protein [Pseudomonas typographi]|uniref:Aminopeptidase P family protein n=1 Tax=Pseudomonas typographi TaxID=2715964 RepID=A0ABR7Z6U9_9PSED|nr:aminopeptidase P family protein [Pseudomonas typographi]MBD1589217.1 aminopeptidase P family protein [Pseudomonas typographi]MBD1601246.1 aminopeptidase P family protein [Pseudomonas typographi]
MTAAIIAQRLRRARETLANASVDALLVPSADPHLSEYLPAYWQGRQWLSGFTGSMATLVVTAGFAGLWADSRYWEQAEAELDGTGITLMKLMPGQPGPFEWLGREVPAQGTVAVDGAVLGITPARALREQLAPKGIILDTSKDLLGQMWEGRPALPAQPVYAHVAPYASETVAVKLARLRQAMAEQGADAHFLATLDDIGWLFNLRGSDVPYNPVFLAFALVEADAARLFVAPGKLAAPLAAALAADGVQLQPYGDIGQALAGLAPGSRLLVDPARVTLGLLEQVPDGVQRVEAINPSTLFKSRKSEADALHIRQAMEEDGAALCEFFAWFEQAQGQEVLTELTVDERLGAARARRAGYVCPSFGTIAAFNANGAMPHYRATEASHACIEGDGLLLIDSGGQYLGGTTDITRMVPIGEPTHEQKLDCTRVLKGMIALSRARFPSGILSPMLDAIARAPLWADSVNYGHGTGHGVGYFMNVHEGPQVIAYQANPVPHTAMHAGMITSIEPGTYRPGQWGVRIENLVLAQPAAAAGFGDFLAFETLTLCPIDTRCLLVQRLTQEERDWLNEYHGTVRARLAPLLEGAALQWLDTRTQAI